MVHTIKIPPTLKVQLLTLLLNIREAEETIVDVYPDQTMRTPTHLSIGQEAVAVGVCAALKKEDQVFSSHRCHAHYLAKGGDLEAMFTELCGRTGGSNGGRIGSAHLSDERAGMYASPILGAMVPVAVGAALSYVMDKQKRVAVAFFGDAAIEEGVFAESLNFAVIQKLPVVFICENNLYSTHSPFKVRQPSSAIYKRISIPELTARQIDGNDVELVYKTALGAVEFARRGKGPAFIECLTYRIREHVGPLMDYDKGYRSKKEVDTWIKRCPVQRYADRLIKQKVITKTEWQNISQQCKLKIREAYQKAMESPWPAAQTLLSHVY